MVRLQNNPLLTACLFVWLVVIVLSISQESFAAAPEIESKISSLQDELQQAGKTSSSIRKRRAYKGVVRKGKALLKAASTGPASFRILELMLQGQKRLLGLENSNRNREELFEICTQLAAAPDELADLRLEADMLLSERDLSQKNADVEERTRALSDLIARYRDTPGEGKSLTMASLIAPKLEAFELEKRILRTMDERFAGDLDIIEWRRKNHGYAHERILFTGEYERVDGSSLKFPIDGFGHTCVMVFWSQETPDIATHLAAIKDLQSKFPGQVVVFSFNVDDLADGGAEKLIALGLDWTALHLPKGRKSQVYRVVARQDPIAVRVNAHGHSFRPSGLIDTLTKDMSMEQNLDDPRYLAQLQFLSVGEFLVNVADWKSPSARSPDLPQETLDAIQDCFVIPPLRYRLTRTAALANYVKAEELCRGAIAQYPKAADLWRVRNRRVIALIGMWKLEFEAKHLQAAVAEARIVLASSPPPGADLAARFCLAKDALRRGEIAPRLVLSQLIEAATPSTSDAGQRGPSASAYAAATVLAMDVSAVDLHATYRSKLLESHQDDASLWPVVSFLVDQNHTFRLFKANYYMPPSRARRIVRGNLRANAAALGKGFGFRHPLKAEFKTLDGGAFDLTKATDDKLTLLLFVEPPADGTEDFPTAINGSISEDARGKKVETKGTMQRAFDLADQFAGAGLQIVAAFLSEDSDRVSALMQKHQWRCQAVLVPGGLTNPLVRRLGLLSADRVPNAVLLRPDGTVAWKLSGILHPQLRSEGIGESLHVVARAMKANIDVFAMEHSMRVFEERKLEEAVRLFAGPFLPGERPTFDEWTAPRLHGRALAHIELEKWDAALPDIAAAIVAHQAVFNARKLCLCDQGALLRKRQASVLEHLGRMQEAEELRKAAIIKLEHRDSRAGRLHRRLESIHENRSLVSP